MINDDFIVACATRRERKDMRVIGLLLVIILLTGSLFAIIYQQGKQIDSLTATMEIMTDTQKNTIEWLDSVHELTVDNAVRVRRLER